MSEKALELLKEHGPAPTRYLSNHYTEMSPQKLAYIYRNDPRCEKLNGRAEHSRKVWHFKENGGDSDG